MKLCACLLNGHNNILFICTISLLYYVNSYCLEWDVHMPMVVVICTRPMLGLKKSYNLWLYPLVSVVSYTITHVPNESGVLWRKCFYFLIWNSYLTPECLISLLIFVCAPMKQALCCKCVIYACVIHWKVNFNIVWT